MAVILPLLPIVISERIGLDKNNVTFFFLINALLGAIVTMVSGYLSDGVIARYKLVLIGGLSSAVGYLGIAAATQPIHAFIAGPITVMLGILFPQLFAIAKAGIVADWERNAQMSGITALRTLYSLGFILGTMLASWLVRLFDIQMIFVLNGIAVALLTVLAAVVLFRIERHIRQRTEQVPSVETKQSVSKPQSQLPLSALVVPLFALIIIRGADSTRGVYLPLVLFQIFHDAAIAPLMFGITAAGELVTMTLIGRLANKIGEKATISIGALVGAVYFLIIASTQSLSVLYLAHLLYAVFIASLLGVAMAFVQGLFADRAGLGGSVYMASMNVGSLIGILSPSLIAGYNPSIFLIPVVLCIAGAIMLTFSDRVTRSRGNRWVRPI